MRGRRGRLLFLRRGGVHESPDELRRRWVVDGLSGPMDGFAGLVHGFCFFLFFISINSGEQVTTLEKVLFTMTFSSRRLVCPPWLSTFACFG